MGWWQAREPVIGGGIGAQTVAGCMGRGSNRRVGVDYCLGIAGGARSCNNHGVARLQRFAR